MSFTVDWSQLLVGGAGGFGLLSFIIVLYRLVVTRETAREARTDARIKHLEDALGTEQTGHKECIHKLGYLEGKVAQLSDTFDRTIRRHDDRNKQNAAMLMEEVGKEVDALRTQLKETQQHLKEAHDIIAKHGITITPTLTSSVTLTENQQLPKDEQ